MQPPVEEPKEDVTALLMTFREVTRHLWNSAFVGQPDAAHDFIDIERALFQALVLRRIDLDREWDPNPPSGRYWPELRVMPEFGPAGCRVMWAREEANCWHWCEIQLEQSAVLAFIGFFDWREEGPWDYQYMRCRVLKCEEHPQIVGADVLLESLGIRVHYLRNP